MPINDGLGFSLVFDFPAATRGRLTSRRLDMTRTLRTERLTFNFNDGPPWG
jgi:hypothetical protein